MVEQAMLEELPEIQLTEVKKIVLIADDSDLVLKVTEEALKDKYHVLKAKDGIEVEKIVAERFEANDISLLLLDMNMPKLDGEQVLIWFNKYNLFDRIPVVIMSGADDKETIDKAFKFPIVDMIAKPASGENIKNMVDKTIGIQEMKRQNK